MPIPHNPALITRVLKIPFDDGGGTKSLGARFGPDAVEAQFKKFPWRCSEDGKPQYGEFVDIAHQLAWFHGEPRLCLTELAASHLALTEKRLFCLSGDNSWSEHTVLAVAKHHKRVALIVFDAHLDLCDDTHDPHAQWVRKLWQRGTVTPRSTLFFGIRDPEAAEWEYQQSHGGRVFSARSMFGWHQMPEDIRRDLNDMDAIVTVVDIDVLDPTIAPGTGVLRMPGLDLRTLLNVITDIGRRRQTLHAPVMVGEITEVIPPKGNKMRPKNDKRPDPTGATILAAEAILREMIRSFS